MAAIDLNQAISDAVAAEEASARFYLRLLDLTEDKKAREFLEEMIQQERDHATSIAKMGARLGVEAGLPAPGMNVEMVETAPGWDFTENLSFADALEVALEAENHAALFYDAVGDTVSGDLKEFFANLARTEEKHVEKLHGILEKI